MRALRDGSLDAASSRRCVRRRDRVESVRHQVRLRAGDLHDLPASGRADAESPVLVGRVVGRGPHPGRLAARRVAELEHTGRLAGARAVGSRFVARTGPTPDTWVLDGVERGRVCARALARVVVEEIGPARGGRGGSRRVLRADRARPQRSQAVHGRCVLRARVVCGGSLGRPGSPAAVGDLVGRRPRWSRIRSARRPRSSRRRASAACSSPRCSLESFAASSPLQSQVLLSHSVSSQCSP